jgi:hypothetical protein
MERARRMGCCLAAVLMAAAIAASSASAAEYEIEGIPEFGRCLPATTPKTGEYKGSHCLATAEGKGSYNWSPGPGPKNKFEGTIGPTTLETVGKVYVIACNFGVATGEYTSPKTATLKLELVGCINQTTHQKCQSGPQEAEIEAKFEGELGFIRGGTKPIVGLDLKPLPAISFTCGIPPELPTLVSVTGSAIGAIKPPDSMRSEFKLSYLSMNGKQNPEKFEEGVKDTLSLMRTTGVESTTEQAGLTIIGVEEKPKPLFIANEEPLEIKAK